MKRTKAVATIIHAVSALSIESADVVSGLLLLNSTSNCRAASTIKITIHRVFGSAHSLFNKNLLQFRHNRLKNNPEA
ncbi:MAG: hypothetical protein WDN75_11515 [Bacteroidota bacterium]